MVSVAPLYVRLLMKELLILAQGANRGRSGCSSCGLSGGATVLRIVISTLVSSLLVRLGYFAYPAASFTTVYQSSTFGAKRFGNSRDERATILRLSYRESGQRCRDFTGTDTRQCLYRTYTQPRRRSKSYSHCVGAGEEERQSRTQHLRSVICRAKARSLPSFSLASDASMPPHAPQEDPEEH